MNIMFALKIAQLELDRFPNLIEAGWKLTTMPRARTVLARCDYRKKEIIMGERFLRVNTEELIRETALHEIAHPLTPRHGHDAVWKAQARALGIPDTRCCSEAVMILGKYIALCPKCKRLHTRDRSPKYERWCLKCGRLSGQLTFVMRKL